MARHDIPRDDGWPHAPTTECGCGVTRVLRDGRYVFVHHSPHERVCVPAQREPARAD
jgi:hypothetical protein